MACTSGIVIWRGWSSELGPARVTSCFLGGEPRKVHSFWLWSNLTRLPAAPQKTGAECVWALLCSGKHCCVCTALNAL
jgi:hypothetical protein